MVEMLKSLILLIPIIFYTTSTKAQGDIKQVYLKDSTSTAVFLKSLSICEKINYAEGNIHDIIKSKGFSHLILISIAKDAKTTLEIRSINGNMIVPDEKLISELRDQINNIRQNKGCRS